MKKAYYKLKTQDDFCVALTLKVNEFNKKTPHKLSFELSEKYFNIYYFLNENIETENLVRIANISDFKKENFIAALEKMDEVIKQN